MGYVVGIIGSKTKGITFENFIKRQIKSIITSELKRKQKQYGNDLIVMFGSPDNGVSQIALEVCKELGIKNQQYPFDYSNKYYFFAYKETIEKIINRADYTIAFWDGRSKGTRYAINYARQNKFKINVYYTQFFRKEKTPTVRKKW